MSCCVDRSRWALGLVAILFLAGTAAGASEFPPRPELGPGESNWAPHKTGPSPVHPLALTTTDLNTLTPQDLADALLGTGPNAPTISNVTFSGAAIAAGTFAGGTGILGVSDGIVLSSGNIASVAGPNTFDNITTVLGTPGDADLNGLVPGYFTRDATVLEFDFECPTVHLVTFNYVFASEEYNEFVNSQFNDVFGFFVNGVNAAIIPGTTTAVAINNVNCNNPYAPPTGSYCELFINNDLNDGGGGIDTEMDGMTVVFSISASVSPGLNHIKLAIADAGDFNLDSNVFIQGGSFVCGCPDQIGPEDAALAAGECYKDTANPGTYCTPLSWTAPGDSTQEQVGDECVQSIQAATSYDVRWSTAPITTLAEFLAANEAAGEPTPAAPGTAESMTVCGLPSGDVYFALRSADQSNNVSGITTATSYCDPNDPPDCSEAAASIALLWPPDHRMVEVGIVGVTDPDGDEVTITITGVLQDEPVNGKGDGNTCPDAQVAGATCQVRAERTGTPAVPGNGRVYTIQFVADDGLETCEGAVTVCVPHDQSPKHPCVDDGPSYDSMECGPSAPSAGRIVVRAALRRSDGRATVDYVTVGEGEVRLGVYDVAGRLVATLASGRQAAGLHSASWDTRELPNGIYYVRLRTATETVSKSFVLLK